MTTRPRFLILGVILGLLIAAFLAIGAIREAKEPACPPTQECAR